MTLPNYSIPANLGVAIVAPGGYAADEQAYARGIERLEKWGCRVHSYYHPQDKYQRFGGTDQARIEQLHAAASNPEVKLVLSLRGGYGTSRIMRALDYKLLANSGKLFVGHSDFTGLHLAMLAQAGAVTFAGPMLCDDVTRADLSDYTLSHFWHCLTHPSCTIVAETKGNPTVDVAGKLWGGNLALINAMLGTPYFPQIDDGILFVEDVNEHPYRVERMLLQLDHAGVLKRQKALVLGDFSNYKLNDYDNGYDFDAMLAFIRSHVQIPVLTGLPFGHMRDKVTLAVGAQAVLKSDDRSLRLSMSGYPVLR